MVTCGAHQTGVKEWESPPRNQKMAERKTRNLPAVIAVARAASDDPVLEELVSQCSAEQQQSILNALRAAYDAGQEAADQRTGKLMARIFGGFVGVTPGIDMDNGQEPASPRRRLVGLVKMLAQSQSGRR